MTGSGVLNSMELAGYFVFSIINMITEKTLISIMAGRLDYRYCLHAFSSKTKLFVRLASKVETPYFCLCE